MTAFNDKARRCIQDLVVLSAPSLWVGKEPAQIADLMADCLFRMLDCAFVFIGIGGKAGEGFAYAASRARDEAACQGLVERLTEYLALSAPGGDPTTVNPLGEEGLHATFFPIGNEWKLGIAAAA